VAGRSDHEWAILYKYFLRVHIVAIPVFLEEPDCMRVFRKELEFHEAI